MAKSSNHLPNDSNVLRFYIDNDDMIVKCDYLENYYGMMHEDIKLSNEELKNLFLKYIENKELICEKKIYDKFILFKFYNVETNEIYKIIKKSKINQKHDLSKFKQNNVNKAQSNGRKVTRKNKFDRKKVMVTLGTLAVLLTSSIGIINTDPNDPYKNDNFDSSKIVIATEKNDYNYQETIPIDMEIESESTSPEVIFNQYIELNTEDWTETEKYIYAKENYYDLITKYSKMYGIDPQVALAIACQERGVHSNKVDDGGGIGLYQIQIEGKFNWENQSVYAYNFETNSNEKYTIHKDQVSNLENNIKAGLMIFQECLRRNDYDVARAIQEYNFGSGNMSTVLASCYTDRNPQTEDNKLDWLAYRNVISGGDSIYLENILKFVKSDSVFKFKDKDGKIITCKYINLSMNDMMKKIGY